MKDTPILFSAPMVRAILDGRKTLTRRVVKWPSWVPDQDQETAVYHLNILPEIAEFVDGTPRRRFGCPCGGPGDRLWVRETYYQLRQAPPGSPWGTQAEWVNKTECIRYAEHDWGGHPAEEFGYSKRPSIFMPRWASRISLDVLAVRVERVQEITEEDARAEGIAWAQTSVCAKNYYEAWIGKPGTGKCRNVCHEDARPVFAQVWDSLNAARGFPWASNPWVWVITFRRLEVPA